MYPITPIAFFVARGTATGRIEMALVNLDHVDRDIPEFPDVAVTPRCVAALVAAGNKALGLSEARRCRHQGHDAQVQAEMHAT
jgi:hypothetical protein